MSTDCAAPLRLPGPDHDPALLWDCAQALTSYAYRWGTSVALTCLARQLASGPWGLEVVGVSTYYDDPDDPFESCVIGDRRTLEFEVCRFWRHAAAVPGEVIDVARRDAINKTLSELMASTSASTQGILRQAVAACNSDARARACWVHTPDRMDQIIQALAPPPWPEIPAGRSTYACGPRECGGDDVRPPPADRPRDWVAAVRDQVRAVQATGRNPAAWALRQRHAWEQQARVLAWMGVLQAWRQQWPELQAGALRARGSFQEGGPTFALELYPQRDPALQALEQQMQTALGTWSTVVAAPEPWLREQLPRLGSWPGRAALPCPTQWLSPAQRTELAGQAPERAPPPKVPPPAPRLRL